MQGETGMSSEILIEGRAFVPVKNGTFAHDIWVTNKVRESGLGEIVMAEGEDHNAFIEHVARKAWESGAILELLGGLYVPAGMTAKDWTPALAAETSAFFADVTDEDSKQQLRQQIGSLLFYFFANALSSSATSPKSGMSTETESAPRATEDAGTSEIGAL